MIQTLTKNNVQTSTNRKTSKVMVGLDLTESDSSLINYAKYLNLILRPEEIHFVHVQDHVNVPEEILQRFPELEENIDSTFIREMVQETEGYNITGTEVFFEVANGKPMNNILTKTHDEGMDLLVVGRKVGEGHDHIVPQKLARKCASDVLLVPSTAKPKISKILVPIDYSDYSKLAIEAAMEIADKNNAEIVCQHIYEVPLGYSKIGKSFEEFADIMKKHAIDKSKEFMESVETNGANIRMVYTLNNHSKLSDKITGLAEEENADLIIMGARGRTDMSAILLGSVTERLVSNSVEIPILIVKKKDKTFGFWDAMRRL